MATIIGATRMIKYKKHEAAKKQRRASSTVRKRLEELKALGYATFSEYIRSEDFKGLRERKLQRHPKCLTCEGKSCKLYFMEYDSRALLGLNDYALVALCEKCLLLVERDETGKKRDLEGSNKALREMAFKSEGKTGKRWLTSLKNAATEKLKYQRKAKAARRGQT